MCCSKITETNFIHLFMIYWYFLTCPYAPHSPQTNPINQTLMRLSLSRERRPQLHVRPDYIDGKPLSIVLFPVISLRINPLRLFDLNSRPLNCVCRNVIIVVPFLHQLRLHHSRPCCLRWHHYRWRSHRQLVAWVYDIKNQFFNDHNEKISVDYLCPPAMCTRICRRIWRGFPILALLPSLGFVDEPWAQILSRMRGNAKAFVHQETEFQRFDPTRYTQRLKGKG